MSEQIEDATPRFHESYAELAAGLPPSQLREAHKRLSKCKQPLTDEEIAGEHPRVQACLARISAAYGRKKLRSALASKVRRDTAREKRVVNAQAEPPAEPPAAAAEITTRGDDADGAAEVPGLDTRACTIECEPEPLPAPLPDTQTVPLPDTTPTAVPLPREPEPRVSPRQPPRRRLVRGAPAPAPAPAPKKEDTPRVSSGNSLIRRR